MNSCIASEVLLVRPKHFTCNTETALDNHYQVSSTSHTPQELEAEALNEFDNLVHALSSAGIGVHVQEDSDEVVLPDAVFPNNWFSTHSDGTVVLYPMKAVSRRRERRPEIVSFLRARYENLVDLSTHEEEGHFLEGTGSLVLDRKDKVAYACLSQRTSEALAQTWAQKLGYVLCVFEASDHESGPIYHTNVMMSVGSDWAAVCAEAVHDSKQRSALLKRLESSGKKLFLLTHEAVRHYCGNILELQTEDRRRIIALSQSAFNALPCDLRSFFMERATLVSSAIPTIEKYGGGSVRCMIAELFFSR